MTDKERLHAAIRKDKAVIDILADYYEEIGKEAVAKWIRRRKNKLKQNESMEQLILADQLGGFLTLIRVKKEDAYDLSINRNKKKYCYRIALAGRPYNIKLNPLRVYHFGIAKIHKNIGIFDRYTRTLSTRLRLKLLRNIQF